MHTITFQEFNFRSFRKETIAGASGLKRVNANIGAWVYSQGTWYLCKEMRSTGSQKNSGQAETET